MCVCLCTHVRMYVQVCVYIYHYVVACELDRSARRFALPLCTVSSRNFRLIKQAEFERDLSASISNPGHRSGSDVDELVGAYDSSIREALDRHAPLVTRRVRVRPKKASWLNERVREARRRRRRAERRWRKHRLTVYREIFVNERKTVLNIIDNENMEF